MTALEKVLGIAGEKIELGDLVAYGEGGKLVKAKSAVRGTPVVPRYALALRSRNDQLVMITSRETVDRAKIEIFATELNQLGFEGFRWEVMPATLQLGELKG